MEISVEKTKLMTNSKNFTSDISINEHKLEYVDKFKYHGAIVSEKGSRPEILARIALSSNHSRPYQVRTDLER